MTMTILLGSLFGGFLIVAWSLFYDLCLSGKSFAQADGVRHLIPAARWMREVGHNCGVAICHRVAPWFHFLRPRREVNAEMLTGNTFVEGESIPIANWNKLPKSDSHSYINDHVVLNEVKVGEKPITEYRSVPDREGDRIVWKKNGVIQPCYVIKRGEECFAVTAEQLVNDVIRLQCLDVISEIGSYDVKLHNKPPRPCDDKWGKGLPHHYLIERENNLDLPANARQTYGRRAYKFAASAADLQSGIVKLACGDKITGMGIKPHYPPYEYYIPWPGTDVREYSDGRKEWHSGGQLHRTDGPAVIHGDGRKEWWVLDVKIDHTTTPVPEKITNESGFAGTSLFGKNAIAWCLKDEKGIGYAYHRTDLPAVNSDLGKFWYQNGKLHRGDGPAIEYHDGRKQWWIDGVQQCNRNITEIGRSFVVGDVVECVHEQAFSLTRGKHYTVLPHDNHAHAHPATVCVVDDGGRKNYWSSDRFCKIEPSIVVAPSVAEYQADLRKAAAASPPKPWVNIDKMWYVQCLPIIAGPFVR